MTDDLTPPEHAHSETVVIAAQSEPPARPGPELRQRFGLSAREACEAIALAQRLRRRA